MTIRSQLVLLVGLMLVGAMMVYLVLATRVVTADKIATVYDVNALLASSVSDQVESSVDTLVDKLRYFGTEQARADDGSDRRARALFDADDDVLALELWRQGQGGFERVYSYADETRLGALNLTKAQLEKARLATPVPLDQVIGARVVLQNASQAPDLGLLRLAVASLDSKLVMISDLRPERLIRSVSAQSVYKVWVVDERGIALAHPDAQKVLTRADLSTQPAVKDALDAKVARGTREYSADDGDLVASYSRISSVHASVVVVAPRSEVFRAMGDLTRRSILFAIAVIALAVIVAVYFSRRLTRPLSELETTMDRVSRGELGVEVPVTTQDEIGAVAQAFNQMSRELGRRSDELDTRNAQLVQSEKLSAIGELSAGLAHEVKNPMVGIVGFSQLGLEAASLEEAQEYFRLIDSDAQRANGILQRLLEFARPPDVDFERLELNRVVEGAVKLGGHHLQLQGVKLETRYADGLPAFTGNNNQLRQVLLNLLMNGAQAMEQSPTKKLTVTTTREEDHVVVRVEDTGPGIAREIRDRLFEPFVTTKPRGKGTGLGLSVSKSIIESHKGELKVESEVGKGACFVIRLPWDKEPTTEGIVPRSSPSYR